MSNIKELIRAEIERRKNKAETMRERGAYLDILSFLDTLEEPVTDCHDLNQSSPLSNLPRHIADEAEDHSGAYERIYRRMDETERWRREHPDEYEKQLNDLLSTSKLAEAAEKSWVDYEYREDPRGLYSSCYIDGFIAGAEWMKQKMMEGAVEGVVYRYESYQKIATAIIVDVPKESLDNKVRIIIVKEEEQ